jgi:cyclophilin family peptidyl-prolyl cis-trans isomerase
LALGRRLLVGGALALALAGCGGGSKNATSTTATTTDENGCIPVSRPDSKSPEASKPKQALDPAKTYLVVMHTNCGDFTIKLATKTSPETTASFANLAKTGFFDHTFFHRIVPGFVIQGGDPTGSGNGGPGYSTVDKPPASTRYTHGVVAMAKTGAEAPGTSGSQFFVVTADDAQLPPDYAVLGTVTKGLDAVDRIGELGDPGSGGAGTPTEVVEIQKATLVVQ